MSASISITGADKITRGLSESIKYLSQEIETDLQDFGNDVTKSARRDHRFGHPYSEGYRGTGNGDRSIQSEANGASVRVFINPQFVSVDSKKYGSFNYIWAQHDGTKFIKADPFLDRAIAKHINGLETKIMKTATKYLG